MENIDVKTRRTLHAYMRQLYHPWSPHYFCNESIHPSPSPFLSLSCKYSINFLSLSFFQSLPSSPPFNLSS
ncbi:hypothetical protein L2E82_44723 [Cichorium intybus]|uniref:Uncharacterized protein n=1 Tax=Cichorium intybus TaxID=13427 RepID=A0ACB8ZS02_CICIN|nr:hypothetical protein L2E82_44723 [Cichorium intybus]